MTASVDHSGSRTWVDNAVRLIEADSQRSADTHLLRYPLPAAWGISLYLKDESTHITGSLKHRLARSLFLYAICNGWVTERTTVIEASSGSTAVSEAYFARLLGLKFVAVMPRSTSPAKVALIESHGGSCHFVDRPGEMYTEAHRLAAEPDCHYMDQFTHAERATDWRGNNNIAESIFDQLRMEECPIPDWVVVGAGTGGTSATIGRYIRYRRHATQLAVVDPENSAFIGGYETGDAGFETGLSSRIEGIGRPRVEPSFVGQVIDRMIAVPDAASVAAARFTSEALGKRVGGSTGTNIWGAFGLISEMIAAGRRGSVVTLLCDGGDRYSQTYFDDIWVADQGMNLEEPTAALGEFIRTGAF
ncbi:cysteine synthase [Rhodococcus sp. 06-412-2C]|uniref:PLP-dependent cysteine synthase family protein n=1 Tax=unclassified Rhodococcus (in: high G+C Gram-positive bacteria) TaxID=192944 RepID=UPI000B9C1DB6|nr:MULTISPECIES: PLP-dependent cysteine synthase family protein [unclassified Rhodococcus (in: high G+C Gram-positive bacteria)]OZC90860.1 cysteine synthase [Rhodococcus sp. 06-412-2C]OZC97885.1 cysteine synthase [Rhodococcus sp. 06-412-2B]